MTDTQTDSGLYLMLGEMRGQLASIKEDTGDTRANLAAVSSRVTTLENHEIATKARVGVLSTVWGALGGTVITFVLHKLGLI